jgi:hypothetical protein
MMVNYLNKENSDKDSETILKKQLILETNGNDQMYKNGKQI